MKEIGAVCFLPRAPPFWFERMLRAICFPGNPELLHLQCSTFRFFAKLKADGYAVNAIEDAARYKQCMDVQHGYGVAASLPAFWHLCVSCQSNLVVVHAT
jgi:hypothetical protein